MKTYRIVNFGYYFILIILWFSSKKYIRVISLILKYNCFFLFCFGNVLIYIENFHYISQPMHVVLMKTLYYWWNLINVNKKWKTRELKLDNKSCTFFHTKKRQTGLARRQFTLLQLTIQCTRNRRQSTISYYRNGFEAKWCSMKWKFNKQTNVIAMFVDKSNDFKAHLTIQ